MSPEEFDEQYQLLAKHIPWQFGSQETCNALSKAVAELNYEWFQKVVAHILLNHSKGNYNIGADIKAEKTRRAQEFSTREESLDQERLRRNSTGIGYDAELRKLGANSLWEAVTKAKGQGA